MSTVKPNVSCLH